MKPEDLKAYVYGSIAQIGKAMCAPKRLELLDLLCQGEKTVETLAARAEIGVKLTSAHLKELKNARLVEARKAGKYVVYRCAHDEVSHLWALLRSVAGNRFREMSQVLADQVGDPTETTVMGRKELLEKARKGEIILLDIRPDDEYASGHLPHARSLPLSELRKRCDELPKTKEIITYCRGSHCLQANEAVKILRKRGFRASRISDGVTDWRAHGGSLQSGHSVVRS